jgi:hypothetical protein
VRAFCGHGKENDCGGLANLTEYEPVGLLFKFIGVRLNVALAKASWPWLRLHGNSLQLRTHLGVTRKRRAPAHTALCSRDLIETLPDGAVVAMIAAIAAASVAKDSIRAAIAPIHR